MRRTTSTVERHVGGFATSIALLVLAGQVATSAHLALVRHDVCATHGELIHPGSSAHVEPAVATSESSGALTTAPRAETAHDDDHCSVVANRRAETAPPRGLVSLGDPGEPPTIHLGAVGAETVSPGVALFTGM